MNKIKEVRISQNMSQKELAEKANLSRYLISRLENNDVEVNITKKTMIKIAESLGKEVTDIFLF